MIVYVMNKRTTITNRAYRSFNICSTNTGHIQATFNLNVQIIKVLLAKSIYKESERNNTNLID